MWLSLDTDLQYRFDGEVSPVAFFRNLPDLLSPSDTLVLGCYDARSDIRHFLSGATIPATWQRFRPFETWDLNRCEYPHGAAFHIRPDSATLQQIILFAQSVAESIDLCDHIAGYSAEHPLFIYHGAFREPLFVSTHMSRSRVETFSRGIDVPFQLISFHQTYSS